MKKNSLIIFITALLLCLCGCSNYESSSKSKEDLFVEQAEKHLKQKYPELEYTLSDVQFSGFMGDDQDTVDVTIENGEYEGRTFQIRRYKSAEHNVVLEDDYFGFLIKDDFNKIVNDYVKKYFTEYQISGYCRNYFENELTSKSTFEDAKRSKQFLGYIDILVKPTFANINEFEKIVNNFFDDYSKEGIKTQIDIYYLKPDVYEKTNILIPGQMEQNVNKDVGYQKRILKTLNEEMSD